MKNILKSIVFLLVASRATSSDTDNFRDRDFINTNTIFKSLSGFEGLGDNLYICDLGAQDVKRTSLTGNNQEIFLPTFLNGGVKSFCDDLSISSDGTKMALADTNGNLTVVDMITKVGINYNSGPDQTCTFCGPSPVLLSGLFGINHVEFSPSGKIYTSSFIGFNAIRLVDPVNSPINYILTSAFGAPDFSTYLNNFVFLDENTIISPASNPGRVVKIVLNHISRTAAIVSVEISGLVYPVATEIDSLGNIYVADRSTGKVHKKSYIDGSVSVIAQLSLGLDTLWLNSEQTHLYVSGNNNDLWRIRLNNNSIRVLISSIVSNPGGIVYDSDKLYVANDWDLRVFDSQGNLINSIHTAENPGALSGIATIDSLSINGDRLIAVDGTSGLIVILNKNTLSRISLLPIGLPGITSAIELENGNLLVAFPNSGLVFITNSAGKILGPIISGVSRPFGLSRNKERLYITGIGGFAPQIPGNPSLPCNGVLATIKISSLLSFIPGPPLGATIIKNGLCSPEGIVALSTKIAIIENGKRIASIYDEEGILLDTIATDLEINNSIGNPIVHFSGIASNGKDFFISYDLNRPGIEVFRKKLVNGCDPTEEYRSYDGSCNNIKNPNFGKSGSFFNRGEEGYEYADGKQEMVNRGNPRTISNKFFAGPSDILNTFDINLLEVFFGQFVNHDIESNADVGDINDPFKNLFKFAPLDPTDRLWRPTLDSLRVTNSSGELIDGVFEVYNNQTAYLDLSTIYGNSEDMAIRLRTLTGGKLLTSSYTFTPLFPPGSSQITYSDLPPNRNLTGLRFLPALLGVADNQIFTSGDHRVHENIILTAMHTIWIRQHNKNADNLSRNHPLWSDERIYQEARKITIAEYQHIVIDEYLPAVIRDNLEEYKNYKESLNPNTLYSFASAAFRYGHSTLNSFTTYDQCFDPIIIAQGPPPPGSFIPPLAPKLPFLGQIGGVPPIQVLDFTKGFSNLIRSVIVAKSAKSENVYVDDIRNIDLSFGGINTGGAGVDLGALDIFRARNNGVPNYYKLRLTYYDLKNKNKAIIYGKNGCNSSPSSSGKDDLSCFLQITSNQTLASELRDFFSKINNIDPVLGILAENIEQGKQLSNTLANIIRTEYDNKRNSDRFWYENDQFDFSTVQRIKSTSFGSIIKRNIQNLNNLPNNVFHVPSDYSDSLKDPSCGQAPLPICNFVTLFPPNCQIPPSLPACPSDGSILPPNCNHVCSNPPSPSDNPTCKPRCVPPSLVTNCHFVAA